MAKIQGPKEGKTYSNIYKEEWTQPWPMGSEIYPKVHENPRVFFSSSSSILLESSIQYPWGVGLHYPLPLGKDLTSNPEVLDTLGSFPQYL
ncbi:hypothetical protein HKD37_02G004765 [Glycine soja]